MTTVHRVDAGRVAYVKGGADVVLGLCTDALLRGETVPMTEELRARLSSAQRAARVVRLPHARLRRCGALDADEPDEGE